ncbi:MAG: ABC transporter permease [Vicinamibacterales bacterium]|nr:ABC transporter permease [Vicinamibacterales bacterium]
MNALADPALADIIALTLRVTGLALLVATVAGVPAGALVGMTRFPGRRLVALLLYTGMGLPPVVVGLFVYIARTRNGVFGDLGWLFTPRAMIAAQTVIAFPLVAGLTMSAVEAVDRDMRLQIRALGATRWQLGWTVLREARIGVTAAIVAAFGGIISEVGAVMLVGGNIEGQTRVLTTAIVLFTRQGDFALAMVLGVVLIALTLVANAALIQLQGRSK